MVIPESSQTSTLLTAAAGGLVALVHAVRVAVTELGCGDARSVRTSELGDATVLLVLVLLLLVLLGARSAGSFRADRCGAVH